MSLSIHECEQGEHISGFLIAYRVLAARGAYNLVPSFWVLPQAAALFLGPVSIRSSGAQGTQQKERPSALWAIQGNSYALRVSRGLQVTDHIG